eukprot:2744454-Prymnesium_polylepis.1
MRSMTILRKGAAWAGTPSSRRQWAIARTSALSRPAGRAESARSAVRVARGCAQGWVGMCTRRTAP